MFNKKNCKKCGRKINDKSNFCSGCGSSIRDSAGKNEDWGMLGKDDFLSDEGLNEIRLPGGFNMIFNSLMKNLNKQFRNLDKEIKKDMENSNSKNKKDPFKKIGREGISISISSLGNGTPKINVTSFGNRKDTRKKEVKEISLSDFSHDGLKNFSKLPKEEPKTNVRRLSDKVIYEIEMPGVKSIKDISVIKLESSIEIKAVSEEKSYSKLIPFNLPIINYNFVKGKLILEMAGN